MQILAVSFKIDDRIPNELSGTVESDVPSALDLKKLDPFALEKLRRGDQVLFLGRSAECDDRRMLDQKQDVLRDRARDAVARDLSLQLEGFGVGHPSERDGPQLPVSHRPLS
jgi:hypothetical protein